MTTKQPLCPACGGERKAFNATCLRPECRKRAADCHNRDHLSDAALEKRAKELRCRLSAARRLAGQFGIPVEEVFAHWKAGKVHCGVHGWQQPACKKTGAGCVACALEAVKVRYAKWRAAGLCGDCGEPPADNRTHCRKCLDRRAARAKVKYDAERGKQ